MPKYAKYLNLTALIAGLLFVSHSAWSYPGTIEGRWSHDNQPAKITATGRNHFLFCNEQHNCADGFFINPRLIRVPNWHVEGSVSHHSNRIQWTNNTTWLKEAAFAPPRATFISGPWSHNGKPTFIKMATDGIHFILINEEGSRTQGYVNENGTLILTPLNIEGHLSHHGRKIIWSNDTVWERY